METGKNIGIFGVGPGSIAALTDADASHTTVFQRRASGFPRRSTYTIASGYESLFESFVPEHMRMLMTSLRFVSDQGTDFTVPTNAPYYVIDFPAVMENWHEKARKRFPHIQTLPPD